MIYPWLQLFWKQATKDINRIHHGLMIVGEQGIGKREFALHLSQFLLCDAEHDLVKPCGQCRGCRLFKAGTHADFHLITSECEVVDRPLPSLGQYADRYHNVKEREKRTKPSRVIVVDQIRELIGVLVTHAYLSARKVALIYPADRMNINAANALLKLLEEPPADTTLILITADPGRLLPTIRSRCSRINLGVPSVAAVSQKWLLQQTQITESEITADLLSLGPVEACRQWQSVNYQQQQQCTQGLLQVLTGRTDPLVFAEKAGKQELETILRYFQRLILSIIKTNLCQCQSPPPPLSLEGKDSQVFKKIFSLYDKICDYQKSSRDPINAQLVVEDIALLASRVL